ncbi:transposase, partial [Streptomyces gardneri]|nr:transposase [Streptomyces gardneri]
MTIVAHNHPYVIGVDTHARNHVLAILAATGQPIDSAEFPTTKSGMARAIAWAARRTGGNLAALWVVEGVATYGAQLAGAITESGYQVVEAPQMNARAHRGVGKSDPLDARRIAEAALPLEETQLRHPRSDEGETGTAAWIGDNRVGLPFGWAGRMSSCRSPIPVSSATMSCVWLAI